jgi:hypothetical protein
METVEPAGASTAEDRNESDDRSVIRSLAELRGIEVQRQADERAAIDAAADARRRELLAAAQAALDVEAARTAAERAAQVAASEARASAERQARLQIEAVDAAERTRQLIALEERRLADERLLQREVALRRRPRWMVGLTALAFATAAGLAWFAVDRARDAAAARETRDRAIADRQRAMDVLRDAQVAFDKLTRDLVDLQARIDDASRRLTMEQTEADRRAAEDRLRKLRTRLADIEDQRRKREQELEHLKRVAPVKIRDECLANAVCK